MARERDINEILGEGAGKLRDRMEDGVNKFRERIEDNVDKVRGRVEDVREQVEEMTEQGRERMEEAWDDVVKFTKKHPGQAIGIAVVVGAALGLVFFGRRRD